MQALLARLKQPSTFVSTEPRAMANRRTHKQSRPPSTPATSTAAERSRSGRGHLGTTPALVATGEGLSSACWVAFPNSRLIRKDTARLRNQAKQSIQRGGSRKGDP